MNASMSMLRSSVLTAWGWSVYTAKVALMGLVAVAPDSESPSAAALAAYSVTSSTTTSSSTTAASTWSTIAATTLTNSAWTSSVNVSMEYPVRMTSSSTYTAARSAAALSANSA